MAIRRSPFPYQKGHYDDDGMWQKYKHCLVYCGENCDCGPPLGVYYSEKHDKNKTVQKLIEESENVSETDSD